MRGARVSHSPRPRGAPTTPGDRRRAHTRRPGRGLHPGTARPPSSGPHAGRLEVGVPGIASARGPAGWEEPPGACLGAWDGGTQRRRARPPGSTQGHGTGGLSTGEGRVTVLGEGLLPAQVVLDPDPVECPGVCILEKQMGCGGGGQRKELGCPRGAPPRHCQGSQLTQPLGRGHSFHFESRRTSSWSSVFWFFSSLNHVFINDHQHYHPKICTNYVQIICKLCADYVQILSIVLLLLK